MPLASENLGIYYSFKNISGLILPIARILLNWVAAGNIPARRPSYPLPSRTGVCFADILTVTSSAYFAGNTQSVRLSRVSCSFFVCLSVRSRARLFPPSILQHARPPFIRLPMMVKTLLSIAPKRRYTFPSGGSGSLSLRRW